MNADEFKYLAIMFNFYNVKKTVSSTSNVLFLQF